jgi:hypothetical protein
MLTIIDWKHNERYSVSPPKERSDGKQPPLSSVVRDREIDKVRLAQMAGVCWVIDKDEAEATARKRSPL